MNDFVEKCQKFLSEYKRVVAAGVIVLLLAAMIAVATSSKLNPMAGAYGSYSDETSNKELNDFISSYYQAYDNNDIDALKKVAGPFSERELSYIKMMSDYIESHAIEELYTKDGSEPGSRLVSVKVNIKYDALENEAPGLDFFYVEKGEDGYYINNAYSLFNLQNGDIEVDPSITSLIAVFEGQQDVADLQAKVQAEHEALMLSDADYNAFFTTSIREAISKWAGDYETALAEEKAAEEAAAAEAEAKAAEEEEKKTREDAIAEDEANKTEVRVTAKVNVRKEASTTAGTLGQVAEGTRLQSYGEEGEWTKVDYGGTRAFIKTEYIEKLDASGDDTAAAAEETEAEEEDTQADAAADDEAAEAAEEENSTASNATEDKSSSLKKGDKVKLSDAVNIRVEMDESSKKAAVAYAGTEVTIIKVYTNGWTEVSYDGKTGFMKTDLIK